MSDDAAVRGIIVGHGSMAAGLADAARKIAGLEEDALIAVSNDGLSSEQLAEVVRERIGSEPTIVFTDLQTGSCGVAARRLCHGDANATVVAGVNLPLLLDFAVHRDLTIAELVPRLLTKGRAGICCTSEEPESHADRAVSSG